MRACVLLPISVLALAGCNSVLGIDDHPLAADSGSSQGGGFDGETEAGTTDAAVDGTVAVDSSLDAEKSEQDVSTTDAGPDATAAKRVRTLHNRRQRARRVGNRRGQ